MAEKTQVENRAEELGMNVAGTERPDGKRIVGTKCPACKSSKVRRSLMRGLFERRLLRPIGVKAYRCEACDQRFFAVVGTSWRRRSR